MGQPLIDQIEEAEEAMSECAQAILPNYHTPKEIAFVGLGIAFCQVGILLLKELDGIRQEIARKGVL